MSLRPVLVLHNWSQVLVQVIYSQHRHLQETATALKWFMTHMCYEWLHRREAWTWMFRSISWLVSKSSSSSPNGLMISSPTYRMEMKSLFHDRRKTKSVQCVKHECVASPWASRRRRRTAAGWKQEHTCPPCDPCSPSQGSEIVGQSRRRQRKSKLL